MKFIESYSAAAGSLSSTKHIGYLLRTAPDWTYLHWLRDHWDGPLIVKGVMRARDAPALIDAGVDAIWVSNHAGRQSAGVVASATALPEIRAAVGPDYPLIFDSGIEGGLDVLRALALGANFVMLGKAFHYGLGALGAQGAAHVVQILKADMASNMCQIGAKDLSNLKGLTR